MRDRTRGFFSPASLCALPAQPVRRRYRSAIQDLTGVARQRRSGDVVHGAPHTQRCPSMTCVCAAERMLQALSNDSLRSRTSVSVGPRRGSAQELVADPNLDFGESGQVQPCLELVVRDRELPLAADATSPKRKGLRFGEQRVRA